MEETIYDKKAKDLSIDEVLNILSVSKQVIPVEAIIASRNFKKDLTPIFIHSLLDLQANGKDMMLSNESNSFHQFAMYLLAEWKVKEAFMIVMELLSHDEKFEEFFFGMMLNEDMPGIIAGVYDGNQEMLFDFIKNKNNYAYARSSALDALVLLKMDKQIVDADIIDLVRSLLSETSKEDIAFNTKLVDFIGYCHYLEFEEQVKYLFDNQLVNEQMIGNYKEYEEYFKDVIFFPPFLTPITDVIKNFTRIENIQKYGYDNVPVEPSNFINSATYLANLKEKVGRNEPCPCGSGKKYKKCCVDKD